MGKSSNQDRSYLVIGLSGVTNGGKSTLSSRLKLHFDPGVVEICALDDHFIKDTSQLAYVESLQMHNWDRMSSLDWEKYYAEATTLIDRCSRINQNSTSCHHIIILEGFLLFNEPRLRALCHLKYDFHIPYLVAKARRKMRNYNPPDSPGYFEQVAWPAYLKHSKEIEHIKEKEKIITLDGTKPLNSLLEIVLNDIERSCNINGRKSAPYYLVVGISGVTNGGKSTLARHIQNHFELGKVTLLSLDDYFIKDTSRLEYLEPLKRYNYDQMKSVDWDLFYQDAQEIIYGYERKHTKWDHVCQYIFILEGFLLFNEWRMRELCSLKYHFVLPYQVAKARRAQRRRTPDHNGTYFDQVVWPAHLNHSKDIQNLQRYERIKTLNGTLTLETLTDIVLTDIEEVCGWNDPEDILHPKFNE